MSVYSLLRFARTLVDIGPRRLQRRLRYDLRQRLDRWLPPFLAVAWSGGHRAPPTWNPVCQALAVSCPLSAISLEPQSATFCFLNIEHELAWPLVWNDPTWPRLWQFHLHYFDWSREWLDENLSSCNWPDQAGFLDRLIDHWIAANPPGRGDGWHSYTLSLRTRNWIWLFRCCPDLATPNRIRSLWQQLCWLQSHPEHCHGGNHWLENLTALSLGGLQFDGPQAQAMHRRAMRLLQQELASQVLTDGGHEERSACYHLLMLDRLVEIALYLELNHALRPAWLVSSIEAMSAWTQAVRLETGKAPRFNDSASDAAPPLDEVVAFAQAYLGNCSLVSQFPFPKGGLRRLLLKSIFSDSKSLSPVCNPSSRLPAVVTDLPSTGWNVLRPGHGWELIFKSGIPCPPHLPPHVHSDQLSFELSHHGCWLISEAGTSVYGNCSERSYERSGAAHNVLQLGVSKASGEIAWIEPVEVWGGFRAARKAQPRQRTCGEMGDASCFASGSHDGFDRIGARHHRHVQLNEPSPEKITLFVDDTVTTRVPLHFRQWWHLAPGSDERMMNALSFSAIDATEIKTSWHSTWFSEGFGRRVPRQSFCISGCLSVGEHYLSSTLPILSIAP